MSELIIHIGMCKAGSSSIQKFLASNENILRKHGYRYADYNNSFLSERVQESEKFINGMMYTFLHGEKKGDNFEKKKWEDFLKRLEVDLSKSNVILSDEAIFAAAAGKDYMACLKSRFRAHRIKCVVYLRRQDMHMESHRTQKIKAFKDIYKRSDSQRVSSMSMGDYCGYCLEHKITFYEYDTYLREFEEIVGKENMAVYTYEDACEYGLCRHFAEQVIKICYRELQENKRVNVSLSPMDTEVKRKLNNAFGRYPDAIKEFVDCLYSEMGLTYCNEGGFQLSPKDREKILDFYSEENKAVAKRYLNREKLFSDKIDYPYAKMDADRVSQNYQNLLVKMIAEIIYAYSYPSIRYVLEQEKQIVLFGAGGMCQKVVQEQEFPVAFIVDNDIEKDGIQVGGVTVVWSGNMDEWDKYFYLITPQDAHEIIIQLENKGLKSGEDFMQIKWETKDMMVLSAS